MAIKATIYDARTFFFGRGHKFLIDTNIWWGDLAPEPSSEASRHILPSKLDAASVAIYSDLIDKSRDKKSCPILCSMIWIEFSRLYEQAGAAELIKAASTASEAIKRYRREREQERRERMSRLSGLLEQVRKTAEFVEMPPGEVLASEVSQITAATSLDAPDAAILATMRKHDVDMILTHDSDYASIEGLHVVTALPRLIQDASKCGKLGKCETNYGGPDRASDFFKGL